MATFIANEVTPKAVAAEVTTEGRDRNRGPARIVRELASTPLSFYNWISGPPTTQLDRRRAQMAEITNSHAHRFLYL